MSYELFVGLRYLKAKRKQTFISIITLISIGGVAIGVTALIVVLSVMDGMHEDLRNKILGTNSHIIVMDSFGDLQNARDVQDKIKGIPHVMTSAPFVLNHAMLNSGRAVSGVVVRGIDPESERNVTDLDSKIIEGNLDDINGAGDEKEPGIILGKELAQILGVFNGDNIDVVSPFGRETPMGTIPKVKKYKVVGIFKTGMYEYDSSLALVSIASAQSFFFNGREGYRCRG
ncbi:MAG: ABC transporter permease [Nitrospinota bacterium]